LAVVELAKAGFQRALWRLWSAKRTPASTDWNTPLSMRYSASRLPLASRSTVLMPEMVRLTSL
jgi:hypothetical protein